MNYIDVCLIILIVLFSFKSIYQGSIGSFFSFFGLLLGVFLAARFYVDLSAFFARNIYDFSPQINNVICFVLILVIVWNVSNLIAFFLRSLPFLMGPLGIVLSVLFGILKSFVFVAIIAYGLAQISFLGSFAQKARDGFMYPIMETFAQKVMNLQVVNDAAKGLSGVATDAANSVGQGLQSGIEAGKEIGSELLDSVK